MDPAVIEEKAGCSFSEACDILEVIEQVLPMSPEGRSILEKPLAEQIKIAKMVLARS